MQNQALPMPQRLLATGHALWALDEALSTRDEAQVERFVRGQRRITPLKPQELTQGHLDFGMLVAREMIKLWDEHSTSIPFHSFGYFCFCSESTVYIV